jgi:DNA-binding response OmpR family regulator/predicted Ser/Thr protein kinase
MVAEAQQSGTILIVEDHPDTRETLRDYLEEFGYVVDTAVDGADGLRKVQEQPVDLVLTDLNMPHVSGMELLAAIKRHKIDTDVLVLSASGLISTAVEAMRLGAVNYLVKPVDLDQLTGELRAVLRARKHRAEVARTPQVLGASDTQLVDASAEATRLQLPLATDLDATLPAPVAEPHVPRTIGRYQVLGELGAGGMGTVYRCHDPALRRTVAVKVVSTAAFRRSHRELLLQRFAREAQAAGMLNHPNIVTVYDYHEEPSRQFVYLAMEYVAGPPLGDLISDAGQLPWPRAARIAFQIADALEYAHRHGIVHRDVKPENVLLAEGDRAKLLDFGIAKLADSSLTRPGTVVGSPRYLAPEVFRGDRVDHRVDQFALGTVFFEMLTGQQPFRFDDFYVGVHRMLSDEPPLLASLGVVGPPLLQQILSRLHRKDPEKRYLDEMTLLSDLAELAALGGGPVPRPQGRHDSAPDLASIP